MAVPKRRTSVRKKNMRRAHDALTAPNFEPCNQCGEAKLRHRACPTCGVYRGRKVAEGQEG